jgi:hypothetical protein
MDTLNPTPGTTAQVLAAPGYPTDLVVTVQSVEGRSLIASSPAGLEEFTLRRNGKWAAKGGGQWQNYLRDVAA